MANLAGTQRLITSPKAWVYTKNVKGEILELTNYVTGGEVNRLINQVSNAKVTLRNPNKMFTDPTRGVTFHPMDPITIFLERSLGHPVQVFTGYLDTTPYYQMFPGTITLHASCTLKKLLYTFFDPALPFVTSFLERFGWINKGDGSIVSKEAFEAGTETNTGVQLTPFNAAKGKIEEGGMAQLLWAMLLYIAEWKDENIWIEALPKGSPELVATLMKNFDLGSKETEEEHEAYIEFMKSIIGSSSHGSGAGEGGGGKTSAGGKYNKKALEKLWIGEGGNPGAANIASAVALAESSGEPNSENHNTDGSIDRGLWQINSVHGAQSTFDISKNTKSAIEISNNGTDWSPWTTFKNGAYKAFLGAGGSSASEEAPTTTQRGSTEGKEKSNSASKTRIEAMVEEADKITAKHYPYAWGGGHPSVGKPSIGEAGGPGTGLLGFDCSGSVSAVLYAGGYVTKAYSSGEFGSAGIDGGESGTPGKGVAIYYNPNHVWLDIEGRYFSTSGSNPGGGAGWRPGTDGQNLSEYSVLHLKGLKEESKVKAPTLEGGGAAGEGEGTSGEDIMSTAKATAFTSEIAFPTLQDMIKAIALTGQKSLMNDQSLFPFLQQVAQASLRSFQSLPNGDFFGFYPDYFGEMGHREPYWLIHNIEILDGGIQLSDDNLATHVFVVGDNTWPISNELINELFSAGTVNIFNAFESMGVLDKRTQGVKGNGLASVMDNQEAIDFLKRYGPRPLVADMPMVRSPVYEMLLAYQQFMLAWSRQFLTPFTFTFMPELFPGGKVGFPEHGLQMYIESVTHQWSLETGYTTTAQLSAPSVLRGSSSDNNAQLPDNMVSALVEPVKSAKPATLPKPKAPNIGSRKNSG